MAQDDDILEKPTISPSKEKESGLGALGVSSSFVTSFNPSTPPNYQYTDMSARLSFSSEITGEQKQTPPEIIEAFKSSIEHYSSDGDYPQDITVFENKTGRKSSDLVRMAHLSIEKDLDQAILWFEEAAKCEESEDDPLASLVSAEANYNLGLIHSLLGKDQEAIRFYELSTNREPLLVPPCHNLILFYEKMNRHDLIVSIIKNHIARYSELDCGEPNREMYFKLGFSYHHLGQLENSCKYYLKAIEKSPEHFDAYYYMAANHYNPYKRFELVDDQISQIKEGKNFYICNPNVETGDLDEACKWYAAAYRHAPGERERAACLMMLAAIYKAQGKRAKEIEAFERALQHAPDNLEAIYSLAVTYSAVHSFEAARMLIEKLERLNPTYKFLNFAKGFYHESQGQWDEAIHHLKNQLNVTPNFAVAQYNLGFVYLKKRALLLAYKWTKSAYDLDQKYQASDNLRIIYDEMACSGVEISWIINVLDGSDAPVRDFFENKEKNIQSEEIIEWYLEFLKINPNDAVAHNNLASEYFRTRKYDEARKFYELSAQRDSLFSDAYYNLGVIYLISNNEKAHWAFEKFQKLTVHREQSDPIDPLESKLFIDGMLALCGKEASDIAVDHFSRLIVQHPDCAELYFFRSQTYLKMGDARKRSEDLNIMNRLKPSLAKLSLYNVIAQIPQRKLKPNSIVDALKPVFLEQEVVDINIIRKMSRFSEGFD